mgnify:CR=1 FL=1
MARPWDQCLGELIRFYTHQEQTTECSPALYYKGPAVSFFLSVREPVLHAQQSVLYIYQ